MREMTFYVGSEVGRLHQVLVHIPELALKRLTPSNKDDLLFDDVLWVHRALEEHEEWREVLTARGVRVHLLGDLLEETIAVPDGRKHILDGSVDEHWFGPLTADAIRNTLDALDGSVLAPFLTG